MREYAALGIASITTVTFGFIISLNSNNKTTYIFDKISIYVTPFLILALFGIAAEYMMHKSKIRNIPLNSLIFFSLLSLIGGVSFVNNYFNIYNKTTVPYAINPVLLSEKIQSDFEKTNFLMPYKPTYNFGPVLGASYWISKAPNDFDLSERKNNQLRLLCFIGDTGCNPITKKIPDSFLESYGIVQFESPLSTEQFMKMTIDEKYKYNFEVFGMEPLLIPDKFKGGNPYYK
jgi:hypothetical protein